MSFAPGAIISTASLTGFASLSTKGSAETISTANATGATTLNLANGNIFDITLIGNTTFTFSGATSGKACSFTLYRKQDATGNRTITWPASVKWAGGVPTLTTAASSIDLLFFQTLDGGTTWYGSLVAADFRGSQVLGTVTNGQDVVLGNVGRAGALSEGVANYSSTLTTLSGSRTYSTTQTIRNTRFTGDVTVTGGNVTFEFCEFTVAPAAALAQLLLYNGGAATGTVTCNWCDFDPGLRGAQGNFETTNFQAGQRGGANPATSGSSFALYRCRLQGCGNNIGLHKFYSSGSTVTECYIADPTSGGGSHPDGMEIYSSDNLTISRSRIMIESAVDQSCINITNDFGDTPSGNPIIIQDNYINGGISPVLSRPQGGTTLRNVRYKGNHFGDSSVWGRECDFNSINVTYSESYALSNPGVIYWANTNVWAPDGEGVTDPALSPSGDVPAGRPHVPGEFVDSRNFYGGEMWIWNGVVLP